jgi:hypothetical protein
MTKAQVILLRDTLKAGKNLPLNVYIDNAFSSISESNILQFTLWDDDNGLLFTFRLPPLEYGDSYNSNHAENISVYTCTYEAIQGLEVCPLPLAELDGVLNSINTIRPISPEMKDLMINTYSKILKENYANIMPEDYNRLIGSNLDSREDYYKGKTTPDKGNRFVNPRSSYGTGETSANGGKYEPTGVSYLDQLEGSLASSDAETLQAAVVKAQTTANTASLKVDDLSSKVAYVDDTDES